MGCAVGLISELRRRAEQFAADEQGSASVEFVVTLPLLMGVMALSFEYGEAFSTREALDSAVRDATRLLIRSPAILIDDASGQRPGLQQYFVDRAREMVAERTGFEITAENFPDPIVSADQGEGEFRTPFYEVVVTVSVEAELPLLSIFGNWIGPDNSGSLYTLTMEARDSARYLGDVPAGDVACSSVRNIHNRANGDPEC